MGTVLVRLVLLAAALGLLSGMMLWVPPQPSPTQPQGREIVIQAGAGNECRADIIVNDKRFRVLLDSGATGALPLVFGRNHARALGFDPNTLSFDYAYSSANGDGRFAKVRLRSLRLETFVLTNVDAQITDAPQNTPLLGVRILHQLNFKLQGGACYLTVPHAPASPKKRTATSSIKE